MRGSTTRGVFGKLGGPLADALLIVAAQVEANKADLKSQVETDTSEMRGYANGARTSAGNAAASAEETKVSLATMQSEYAAFIAQLETAGDAIGSSAAKAEAAAIDAKSSLETIQKQTTPLTDAIETLTHGEAKGVGALLQILQAVGKTPDIVDAAVKKVIYIDAEITETGDGKQTAGQEGDKAMAGAESTGKAPAKKIVRLEGDKAMAYIRYGLSFVSLTAGNAVKSANKAVELANDAKSGLDALGAAVAEGFKAVDAKLALIMYDLAQAGINFQEEYVAGIEQPSYEAPKTKSAAPQEPAGEPTSNKGDSDG